MYAMSSFKNFIFSVPNGNGKMKFCQHFCRSMFLWLFFFFLKNYNSTYPDNKSESIRRWWNTFVTTDDEDDTDDPSLVFRLDIAAVLSPGGESKHYFAVFDIQ
jgi:hypothetical protein